MRKLISIVVLLFSTSVFAQPKVSLDNPKASFVSIIVSNIDSSVKWYQGTFGMTLKSRGGEKGNRYANLERSRWQVELLEVENSVSPEKIQKKFDDKTIRLQGIARFGIRVREFDAWTNFLKSRKIAFIGDPATDANGKRLISIKDPDGNIIQVAEE